MKLAYFDCFAGASGDMILGALLDAGLDRERLLERLGLLNLPGWRPKSERVLKNGLAATAWTIETDPQAAHRHLSDIERIIQDSGLETIEKETAIRVFRRLAEAEAQVHGMSPADVHFHEVGAVDAILDIVGAVCGLRLLGVEAVQVSPLPLGRGFTRAAHGLLPLPAPAVVALLKGVPVCAARGEGETVTPTGAALLVSLAQSFGPLPAMRLEAVGYGAGRREAEYPNVLRVLLGEADGARIGIDSVVMLQTNIDDMNPQVYDHLFNRLAEAGGLDTWLTPAQMKKNRPGQVLSVLCPPGQEAAVSEVIFRETTTLGLRRQLIERRVLNREMRTVQTAFGEARVKVALAGDEVLRLVPEYDDGKRLAEASGAPLRDVLAEIERAARAD